MKKILMIATGGTIASMDQGDGLTPVLTSEQILEMIPEARSYCDVDAVQLMNLDSTDMTPARWLEIAGYISERYETYDGFVVTHGTDTMAYTAAALSYLIQNSAKPVVLTGSQKSIFHRDTDARMNLLDSFVYAVSPGAAGVSIVFGGRVILGTRARKERSKSFNAFHSVDYPDVAAVRSGKVIPYLTEEVRPGGPAFYDRMEGKILLLTLIPGMSTAAMTECLDHYDALVLQSFGVGGLPGSHLGPLADALRGWTEQKKPVVMMTQVPYEGSDMQIYQVGQKLKAEFHLIEAYSMTLEAVITKLLWAMGQTRDTEEIRRLFYTEVRHDIIEA